MATLLRLAIGAFSIALINTPAFAQSNGQQYQINVIVFERIRPPLSQTIEKWPRDIALSYPISVRHLIDASANEQEIGSTEDFTVLAPQFSELLDAEDQLKRSRNYRVLFHKAWLQTLQDETKSPAIIVQGGDIYNDHYELEGTIQFSVSRYLHAKANLWITEFESNYGQLTGQWPSLPDIPQNLQFDAGDSLDGLQTQSIDDLSQIGASENVNPDVSLDQPTNFFGDQRYNNVNLGDGLGDIKGLSGFDNQNDVINSDPFVIKTIATLDQRRRMRSGELHYIDHPKLGVIIKVSPYDAPEPSIEEEPLLDNTIIDEASSE